MTLEQKLISYKSRNNIILPRLRRLATIGAISLTSVLPLFGNALDSYVVEASIKNNSAQISNPENLRIVTRISPRNNKRQRIKRLEFIILHTTEQKLWQTEKNIVSDIVRCGKSHYVIMKDGTVVKALDDKKQGAHAGSSMWNGRRRLNDYSIGIEHVGNHNQPLTREQECSSRLLIAKLQSLYEIPDKNILTHSMVAFAAPNLWHRRYHRYRRCAMLLAQDQYRERLGILHKHSYDPDVRAGRLAVGDRELAHILYRESAVRSTETMNVSKSGHSDNKETEFMQITKENSTAHSLIGGAYKRKTTIYFLADGRVRTGEDLYEKERFTLNHLPIGTRILPGYVYGGHVHKDRPPKQIAGNRWNNSHTFYVNEGKISTGDNIDPKNIPASTLVLFRN